MSEFCGICRDGTEPCQEGISKGREVIHFLKDLLHLRKTAPFPLRYENLTASCFALGQYLHGRKDPGEMYFTDNQHLLKHADVLRSKFDAVVRPLEEAPKTGSIHECCELSSREILLASKY